MAELLPPSGDNTPPPPLNNNDPLGWFRQLIGPAATGQSSTSGPLDIPALGGALRGLDTVQRVGIDAPEGLYGIGLQKLAELAGGGRGQQEQAVTSAVTSQTDQMPWWLKPLATAALYPAAASEAKRISQQQAAEQGVIPSVQTPLGRFDLLNAAEMALPVGGLTELGLKAAAGAGVGIPAKLSAFAGRDAATIAYRTEQAANRLDDLTRSGVSRQAALDQIAKEFPNVREGDVAGLSASRANQAAEQSARGLARSQAGDLAQAVGYTGDLSTGASRVGAGAAREAAAAVPYDVNPATGTSVDNVVQFPGRPAEAVVPSHVASPGPAVPIPGAEGPNVGEALARAQDSKTIRMASVADKTMRGEPITASQAAEFLDYLKQIDPSGATEYDRMIGMIPKLEADAVSAAKFSKEIGKQARAAERNVNTVERRLAKAEKRAGEPVPFSIVGATRGASPLSAERFAEAQPLADAGARLDAATAAVKTGYSQVRDEQILRDATINTGKVDNPEVASTIAQTIRENPEGFAAATRSVPLEVTMAKSADYLGVDIAELQREMARRGFTAGENAAFLTGVNGTMARLGSELHALSKLDDPVAYALAEGRFLSFARSVGGANSEAGRTLNALRMQRPLAFINAEYAQETARMAGKNLEAAAKTLENANVSGRTAAYIAKREQDVAAAQKAYEVATQRARTLGEQARAAAIVAAEKGGLGAAKRKYIAQLDPSDIDTMMAALKATSEMTKWDKVASGVNIFKTLKSTFDFSAPFRQGVVLSAAHPLSATRAVKAMLDATFHERNANRMLNELLVGEGSTRRRAAGVYIGDWRRGPLTAHEEAFMSAALNGIPVVGGAVQASERAYTMYLNKLRADVFDNAVAAWDRVGLKNRPAEEKGLASFINWASGRGSLGSLNSAAPMLNGLFFSPRFAISRFQTPLAPAILAARGQGEAAKMAAADLVKFVGAGLSVLALAKMGGATVESDPRSTNFGKVQVGNTVVDIWGGFQQNARYISQFVAGQTKSAAGQILDMGTGFGQTSRWDLVLNYLQGKLAPIPAEVKNVASGENATGNPTTPGSVAVGLGAPLGWADVYQAAKADKENAIRGAVIGSLSLAGVGVQSNDPSEVGTQVTLAKKAALGNLLKTPTYQNATPEQRIKYEDKTVADAGRTAKLAYYTNIIKTGSVPEVVPAVQAAFKAAGGNNLSESSVLAAASTAGKLTPDVVAGLDGLRKQTKRSEPNYQPTVAEYLQMNKLAAQWIATPEFRRGDRAAWDAAATTAKRLRDALVDQRAAGNAGKYSRDIADLQRAVYPYYDKDGSVNSEMVTPERRKIEKDPLWPLVSGSARSAYRPKSP